MAWRRPPPFLQQIARLLLVGVLDFACAGHERARTEPTQLGMPESSPAPGAQSSAVLDRSSSDVSTAQPELPEPAPVYPFHEPLPGQDLLAKASARRYANLSPGQCRAELAKRKLAVKRVGGAARGIATPLRLVGPIQGVQFLAPGRRSVYGMLDCRLALALDEFALVLTQHNVVKVRVDNMYRPRARLPGRRHKKSQHAYGLAVDVVAFELSDQRKLAVERDWQGSLGEPPCGPTSRLTQPTEEAVLLRNLVCDVARRGVFHYILTPSYNLAHRDHVHLDIMRDAKQIEVK